VSRKRIFRVSFVLIVMLMIVAGGGLYYNASGKGTDAAADTTGGDAQAQAAEAADGENTVSDEGEADAEEEGDPPVPVRVADVETGSVATYITATANLVPEDQVQVQAESEGRVTQLLVEEGDFVQAGQRLATLLRDEAEIRVAKAKVRADGATVDYERAQRAAADELIPQEDLDRLTMEHRVALQELAEAEWQLAKTEIRAPFDGRVTMRDCTLGQHVRPGDELFTVTDFNPLIARIYLPEKEVLTLDAGREVKITLKADDEIEFAGRIRQISPVVDTSTGTVKVTIAATRPPRTVRPGGFVTVGLTRERRDDAMMLPREAVVRELKSAHVFVARDGVAEKRTVELGLEEDDRVQIVSGLGYEDRIIVAGQGDLDDGDAIKVLEEETASADTDNDSDRAAA
jgi:membrane fusion protein (multidrug efflux system)